MRASEKKASIKSKLREFRSLYWTQISQMRIETMPYLVLQKFYFRSVAKNWIFVDATLDQLEKEEPYVKTNPHVLISSPIFHRDSSNINCNTLQNNIRILLNAGLLLRVHKVKNTASTKRYAINIPGLLRYISLKYQETTLMPDSVVIKQFSELEKFFIELYQDLNINLPVVLKLNLNDPKLIRKPSKPRKTKPKYKNNVLELVVGHSK